MSIDVFGHTLNRAKGSPGPPGIGYKLTIDGQYDIENKKLCNVADPQQPKDVVNLETLRKIIQIEIQGMIDITTRLRSSLDDLDIIVENHRDEIDAEFKKIKDDILTIKEAMAQQINH